MHIKVRGVVGMGGCVINGGSTGRAFSTLGTLDGTGARASDKTGRGSPLPFVAEDARKKRTRNKAVGDARMRGSKTRRRLSCPVAAVLSAAAHLKCDHVHAPGKHHKALAKLPSPPPVKPPRARRRSLPPPHPPPSPLACRRRRRPLPSCICRRSSCCWCTSRAICSSYLPPYVSRAVCTTWLSLQRSTPP
ncbi:hypothetical protein FGB62_25g623 [Gracilaria domingensis]|nr:hypothetical protein FGB62_25g623 [Gracilaria domingensis]